MKYGRYQILSELGRGSMGMVYQAHDPQIDRLIALKVLREDRLTSEDYVKRFLKEATAVGRLSHPGIVTVYDVGQDHGTVYIAMEFLEGQSLDTLIKNRAYALSDIIRIGIQAAEALHYAHERGIVHRDIKPPNIICDQYMTIKITDFGIAHIDDPDGQQMTRAGEILGTPVYMAPEQVLGQQIDGRSDIYSLGVILYELTTGQRPFQGESLASLFQAITLKDPVAPDQLNHEIPPALCQLIMKTMARRPEDRFVTGRALADQLASCLTSRMQSPSPGQKKPSRARQQRSSPFLFLLLFLLLSGAGLAVYQYLWPLVVEKKQETELSIPAVPTPKEGQGKEHNLPGSEPAGKPGTESKKSSGPEPLTDVPAKEEWVVPEPKAEPDRIKDSGKMIIVKPGGLKKKVKRKRAEQAEDYEKLLDEILSEEKPKQPDLPAQPAEQKPPPVSEPKKTILPVTRPVTKPVTRPSVPTEQPVQLRQDDKLLDEILSEEKPKRPDLPAQPAELKPPVSSQPKKITEPVAERPSRSSEKKKKKDPPKNFATLKINSRPAKAKLYLDGDYKGETPVELQVSAAKHEVTLELQGHLDWKAQLDLSKGEDLSVSPRLAPE
ncbi:protein kinase [Desulfobulbus sp. US4]|nr:protein kinase [Desulfobulbus sp. US4]